MREIQLLTKLFIILTTLPSTKCTDVNSEAGKHCALIPAANNSYEYHCLQCLFPQNCLTNNTCRGGTYGDTCEKCVRGREYHTDNYRIGNTCAKCPSIPWSIISFGVFFVLACLAVVINGFTDSVCTKLKLMCHFVQYMLLCFHIKIPWPEFLIGTMSVLNFGCFNTNIIIPDCLFPELNSESVYYMAWISSLALPLLVFVVGKFIDNIMAGLSQSEKSQWGAIAVERYIGKHRRTTLRRLVFFVLVIMYLPVTVTGIRTYLCSDSVPVELVFDHSTDVFLLDNDMSCTSLTFNIICFIGTFYIMVYVVAFPVLIVFLTLRQRKWDLLYTQWTLYGPAYESYKDFFCFGEAVHLLRKFISFIVTDAYPIQPFIQIMTQLVMSGVYLLLLLILRPYRKLYWGACILNIHVTFEVVSTVAICLTQTTALLINLELHDPSLEIVAMTAVCVVILAWIVILLAVPVEKQDQAIMDKILDVDKEEKTEVKEVRKKQRKILHFWQSKKVGPDPEFMEKVEERKQNINF